MGKYVWMKVTDDEYELPLAIADSSVELSLMLGLNPSSVGSAYCRSLKYGFKTQYKKVRI